MTERIGILTLLIGISAAGCREPTDLSLPSDEEVEAYYTYGGRLEAEVTGNVAVLTIAQPPLQLRRGGALWAKVGPYIFLFSEETRQLLEDYPGLAAVRVETTVGRAEVASALLARDALSDIRWRRSLNIAGRARLEGTERVTLLEALVRWGEDHTEEYHYNPRYARGR